MSLASVLGELAKFQSWLLFPLMILMLNPGQNVAIRMVCSGAYDHGVLHADMPHPQQMSKTDGSMNTQDMYALTQETTIGRTTSRTVPRNPTLLGV